MYQLGPQEVLSPGIKIGNEPEPSLELGWGAQEWAEPPQHLSFLSREVWGSALEGFSSKTATPAPLISIPKGLGISPGWALVAQMPLGFVVEPGLGWV